MSAEWFSGDPLVNEAIDAALAASAAAAVNAPANTTSDTGSTLTLLPAMINDVILANSASAQTITLPQDSAEAIPIGSKFEAIQLGAGLLTVAAGSGATLHKEGTGASGATLGQYSKVAIIKVAANTYVLSGDIIRS